MAEARVERSAGLTAAVVLLALSSGAVDALSFIGLGAVFASVMTGNLVLLGVAIVHENLAPALAAGSAIAAYVAGVFVTSAWLRHTTGPRTAARGDSSPRHGRGLHTHRAKPARNERADRDEEAEQPPSREPGGSGKPGSRAEDGSGAGGVSAGEGARTAVWAWRLRRVLIVVPVAQAVVLYGWVLSDGRPGATARLLLLVPAAFATGVQSAGVNTLPLTGAATTYLTGTLTTLTTELATSGVPSTIRRRFALLAAAFAGAALDAALLEWARPAAPVIPLAATLAVLLVLTRTPGRRRSQGRTGKRPIR